MKNVIIQKAGLTALAFGWLIVLSCSTGVITGQTVRETRDLPAFYAVALTMSANVFISQGNPQRVEVEAEKSNMEIIETELDGNTLKITTQKGHWRDLGKVNVYITVSDIRSLSVSGSGDITCQTVSKQGTDIDVSGSGSISVPTLESSDIAVTITGSGNNLPTTPRQFETLITDPAPTVRNCSRPGDIITGSVLPGNVLRMETNITEAALRCTNW
jgi:hypothetical protein